MIKLQTAVNLIVIILLIAGCAESERPFFEDREVLTSNDRVAAWAIPNIVTTPNGVVLCFATARIGDNHDWGNVQQVVMLRSADNGATWQGPQVIAAIDDWTVRQTSAIVDPETERILVFGHKSPRFNAEGERISETWNMAHPAERKALGAAQFFIESRDDGLSWSEMKEIDLPYWPHDPGIGLKYGAHKGRLILPARTNRGTTFDWKNLFNGVLISDDHGDSWRAGGLTQSHVGEACVVELSDGRVYVNSRNHNDNFGVRVHAISSDGGETFTEFGSDPQLIEPTCDAGMVRYNGPEDGNVILFSNPAVKATRRWDGPSRRRMSVKASFDDCQTWPLERLVFAGPSAYSGLAVGRDGMIFLVYERASPGGSDSRENLAIARFNLAWLKQEELSPPEITPSSVVFYQSQQVSMRAADGAEIRYTLDGSDPDQSSSLYDGPFEISESALLKAAAFSADGRQSIITPARLVRSDYPPPEYDIPYSEKYPASGSLALVDGLRGSLNYNDGRWQGFEGDDFDVTIDLGKTTTVGSVSADFLQSTDFWIFYPAQVTFSTSLDGQKFTSVALVKNENPAGGPDLSRKNFTAGFTSQPVRYVRIQAQNIKTCPSWHAGAGGKAWLFIDEVDIK